MDKGNQAVDALERWFDEGGAVASGALEPASAANDTSTSKGHQLDVGRSTEISPETTQRAGERLPSEMADWITASFVRFFKIEAAAAVLLLIAAIAALTLSNSPWSASFAALWDTPVGLHFGSFEFARSLQHWINDGLMTLFFFVVALELKRELVLGELRNVRTAALSFAGALGGILVPVCIYLLFMIGRPGVNGWGTVTATSPAFVVGCLAVLGSRIPPSLRLFLLSLAIFDDVGAIVIVAIGYGEAVRWPALAAVGLGLTSLAAVSRFGIRSLPVYFVIGGFIWLCFDVSGIHPTLTGVALGLMTPTRRWVSNVRLRAILGRVLSHPVGEPLRGDTLEHRELRQAGTAARESRSPVERLEMMLHPWVGFVILPIFALANAGVAFSIVRVDQPAFAAIVVAFVLGKPLGVFLMSWLVVRLGIAKRPPGLSWPLLAGGGLLTGIGFTMALFIAGLAYSPELLDAARIGILIASIISGTAGILVLMWLTSPKRTANRA